MMRRKLKTTSFNYYDKKLDTSFYTHEIDILKQKNISYFIKISVYLT